MVPHLVKVMVIHQVEHHHAAQAVSTRVGGKDKAELANSQPTARTVPTTHSNHAADTRHT